MNKILRKYLSLAVALSAITYATGDYLAWWDGLTGRADIILVLNRLTYNQGGSKVWVFDDEIDMRKVMNFICDYTIDDSLVSLTNQDRLPSAFSRMGYATKPDIGDHPEGWPSLYIAYPTSPVVAVYEYSRGQMSHMEPIDFNKTAFVGTLIDLTDWVEQDRSRERFWIGTLLLSLLSLAVSIYDKK